MFWNNPNKVTDQSLRSARIVQMALAARRNDNQLNVSLGAAIQNSIEENSRPNITEIRNSCTPAEINLSENGEGHLILHNLMQYGRHDNIMEAESDSSLSAGENEVHNLNLLEPQELSPIGLIVNSVTELQTDSNSEQGNNSDQSIDDVNDPDYNFDADLGTSILEGDEVHRVGNGGGSGSDTEHVNDIPEPNRKKAKKGRATPKMWKRNENKLLRMHGDAYQGVKKNLQGKFVQNAERKERKLGPRCQSGFCRRSKKRHCEAFLEENRKQLHDSFWQTMDWNQKKVYVSTLIDRKETKHRTTDLSKRNYTLVYNLKLGDEKKTVCKKTFLNTLALKETTVKEWVKRSTSGMHVDSKSQTTPKRKKAVHQEKRVYVSSFLEMLPKLPSHYCRATTTKLYLHPPLKTVNDVFVMYCAKATEDGQKLVCRQIFAEEFENMNLSTFHPKKDQCDVCCSYEVGNFEEEEYQAHILRRDEARAEKDIDKENAKNSNDIIGMVTVDVQAVLICPYLKASALYYKKKLLCHNFTVYNVHTKCAVCYFWHEGEGDMTANMFASCLINYIMEKFPNMKEIIIYSDGCMAQNKNVILSNALLHYAIKSGITITNKYLEKGHTQMECDSVHSVVEYSRRNQNIYVPAQYVDLIETARKKGTPYQVKYIEHGFFQDYSGLDYYNSIRPGKKSGDPCVTDLRCLKYSPKGTIQYKLNYSDLWEDLPQRVKTGITDEHIRPLYNKSPGITAGKYSDLQDIKFVLPKDYHTFYDALPCE